MLLILSVSTNKIYNPISVREGWQDDDAAFRQKSLTRAYLLYMSFIALETI